MSLVAPATPLLLRAPVVDQREVAPAHYRLQLHAPSVARDCRPGQFVHLLPRASSTSDPLLRRAFSVAAVWQDDIDIVYRVEGVGTRLMSRLRTGDEVDILGPLGIPFPSLAPHCLLVGGGVGVPALTLLATTATPVEPESRRQTAKTVRALIGARTASDVICVDDFEGCGVPVETATDDGSAGHHGFVTELLRRYLEQHTAAPPAIFSCGPWPMLRAVAALAAEFQALCYVSLEESMPCGIGVCNGCVVPATSSGDDYGKYRRVCIEGPVFDSREVDWSVPTTHA